MQYTPFDYIHSVAAQTNFLTSLNHAKTNNSDILHIKIVFIAITGSQWNKDENP